jgi:hypothetical protein
MFDGMLAAAPAMVLLTSVDNSRKAQFDAGRATMRLALATTQASLCLHPVSDALQELPEMIEPLRSVHALTETAGSRRVQMLFRIGYGPNVDPQPRRPLEGMLRV